MRTGGGHPQLGRPTDPAPHLEPLLSGRGRPSAPPQIAKGGWAVTEVCSRSPPCQLTASTNEPGGPGPEERGERRRRMSCPAAVLCHLPERQGARSTRVSSTTRAQSPMQTTANGWGLSNKLSLKSRLEAHPGMERAVPGQTGCSEHHTPRPGGEKEAGKREGLVQGRGQNPDQCVPPSPPPEPAPSGFFEGRWGSPSRLTRQ